MALLGKISAVLTASTADFTRKIGLAKNDLASFQKRVSGIQLNLNTRALDGTLTKLQKFKREVDELRRLRNLGVDLGFDPRRLTDQFKVFEEIGKPLTDVKNKIEGLSLSIQAELYPELEKVSSGFRNLYRDIETGVTTWDKSEKRVTALTASLSRLSRATAAAADFGRLSAALRQEAAGASFFQPRAQESLQRSRTLRDQASQVPARFRSDAFADLADSADENAARIERQAARVIAIEARIARQGATPNLLNARSVAQDNLDSLTRRQEAINDGFQRQIRESRLASIISPEDVSAVDLFATRLESLSSQLRAIDSQQFQGLISNATAVVRQFNAGEVSAKKAKQAVDALAASLSSVNTGRTLENQTRSLLFTDPERRRQQIQSDFDRERSAGVRGAEQRRDVNLTRERLNNEIIPRTRNLQQQASESGDADLQRRAERLTQLSRQINNELSKATRSANNGQVDAANRSIASANTLLERQLQLEQQISRELDEINAARRQQDMFLEASGGRGELLSQGATDAAADISTARQFRGQIASGASRIAIQAEIDQVTTSVTRLQREIARVANSNLGSREKIAELDRLDNEIRQSTQNLAKTVAKYSGGAFSEQQVAAAMRLARNTAGSISTRGAASAQLAIQQGLFAIDDLISSTGGLEYKLRAVGNNITQLGLLLGQSGVIPGLTATTGLFIGLATILGGQAISAIVRWYNEGRTAEDQTKALNDALARQKSLVEELAGAFANLGDSIAERAFSEPAQQARAFLKQLQEIADQQRDLRREILAGVNPFVQNERGNQNRIRRELESETDVARRLILERQLRESQRREQGAVQAIGDRRGVPGALAQQAVFEALLTAETAAFGAFGPANEAERQAAEERARQRARQVDAGRSSAARQSQLRSLEEARSRLEPVADQSIFGFGLIKTPVARLAAAQLNEIESLIRGLENPLRKALDDAAINLTVAGNDSATQIEQAQAAVAEAIRAGVPGARLVEQQLNSLGSQLEKAFMELESAIKVTDVDERTRLQAQAEGRFRDVSARQRAAIEAADVIRREQTVDTQSTLEARLQRAQQNLQGGGVADGRISRRLREIEFERETLRQRSLIPSFQTPETARNIGLLEQDLVDEAAAIEAATIAVNRFAEALNRASQEAQQNLQSAQQAADQSRRDDLGFSTPRTRDERAAAEAALQRQIELERQVQAEIANARSRLEEQAQNSPELQATFQRIRDITEQLASGALSSDQQAALRQEREALQASIDQQVQLNPAVQAARDASTQEEEQRQAAARGRRLALTPSQQAAEDLARGIEDIRQAFGQAAVEGTGLVDVQAQQEAINRLVSERARQTAPAIFGLADSVANAVLQGPSRAALNVSDISTQEGARELNRLLRGDDSARDQNLIELQRQSQALDDVNAKLTALGNRVGVAL